jgi:GNAT superfamily N-acetyltransferase
MGFEPIDAPRDREVVVRSVTAADGPVLRPWLGTAEPFERRLANGDIGVVATTAGEIIGCAWATTRPVRLAAVRMLVRPRPGELYSWGLYVAPKARNRGVARALENGVRERARGRGLRSRFRHFDVRDARNRHLHIDVFGGVVREEITVLVLLNRRGFCVRRRRVALDGARGR